MKTIYTIPAPDSLGAIEVYGEPENAWYEWRIIDGGRTVRDTGTEGHGAFQGRQYGQPEIALRDALMEASGLKKSELVAALAYHAESSKAEAARNNVTFKAAKSLQDKVNP